jgi:hypothetical protein
VSAITRLSEQLERMRPSQRCGVISITGRLLLAIQSYDTMYYLKMFVLPRALRKLLWPEFRPLDTAGLALESTPNDPAQAHCEWSVGADPCTHEYLTVTSVYAGRI